MSQNFIKIGYADESVVKKLEQHEFENLASPEITERLNKFAQTVRAIAPRSDDFLYFSIIFLKAAEAATIDDYGNLKKVGKENAWGYFDEKWKWHGNVKPHKNNNSDIFPESELKKAARSWIGRPLCVDHKSDSVDGVRGIILDTYYDERRKQVVGLCALDKVNYPDLARKVMTGIVRYGSMGTAVSTSICTECGQKATTPKEYCNHITNKQAWGEINVGLNPIEYSLVVQPAEPGAILLRCFASIKKHDEELKSYGFDTNTMLKDLSVETANDLDILLNSVCGPNGCSLDQRERIIRGYLNTNGFTKVARVDVPSVNPTDLRNVAEAIGDISQNPDAARAVAENIDDPALKKAIKDILAGAGEKPPQQESATSGESIPEVKPGLDFASNGAAGALIAGNNETEDPFNNTDDLLGVSPLPAVTSKLNNLDKINSIMEEIMNESRLRKRAALRRRLAYPQGGEGKEIEPATFKSQDYKQVREHDKQMEQDASMGGDKGMFPKDKELKEKLLRAQSNLDGKKIAYFQGGSDSAPEPSTFKSQDYHKFWENDKQMHQTKSMGGEKGMFPGDEKVKEHLKRAKYNGPTLSTKFKQKVAADGSINKAASCFEVYSGNKLVIAATAKDIFGPKLNENWDWITSKDYAREVVAQIRQNGLEYVGKLLTKTAQAAPPPPPAPPAPAGAPLPPPAGDMGMGMGMDDLGLGGEAGGEPSAEEEETSPQQVINDALDDIEEKSSEIRDAVQKLVGKGDKVDVNVNVGESLGESKESESADKMVSLSRKLVNELKIALAESQESADELALLSETYDRYSVLTPTQKKELHVLASDALNDYSTIVGQARSLVSMANTLSDAMVKKSSSQKDSSQKVASAQVEKTATVATEESELVASALELRQQRRFAILKEARKKMVEKEMKGKSKAKGKKMEEAEEDVKPKAKAKSKSEPEPKAKGKKASAENEAHDGEGMMENAPISGVTKTDARAIAEKAPTGNLSSPSVGNEEVSLHDDYSSAARHVAEGESHGKMNEAKDSKDPHSMVSKVEARMSEAFMNKKAEEEREAYRIKLRRAYNVAMEMQRKGMLAPSRPALDRQVDVMMEFDDKAFEAFKRSVANFQGSSQVKVAADVSGLNIGLTEDGEQSSQKSGKLDAKTLASLWE
jgi:hypothetical protein